MLVRGNMKQVPSRHVLALPLNQTGPAAIKRRLWGGLQHNLEALAEARAKAGDHALADELRRATDRTVRAERSTSVAAPYSSVNAIFPIDR